MTDMTNEELARETDCIAAFFDNNDEAAAEMQRAIGRRLRAMDEPVDVDEIVDKVSALGWISSIREKVLCVIESLGRKVKAS